MPENSWSESKQRVNAHLQRLDNLMEKQEERTTRIVKELHDKIDGVREGLREDNGRLQEKLGEMDTDFQTHATSVCSQLKSLTRNNYWIMALIGSILVVLLRMVLGG